MKQLIILVGAPGSGKSTYCKKLKDYRRINQDDLGSRERCQKHFSSAIQKELNIVLDRCNHTRKQRKSWVDLAKQNGYNIRAVGFSVNKELLLKRAMERKDHPTIHNMTEEKVSSIIDRFLSELKFPTLAEGFDSIEVDFTNET
jgi:atypical dual specificity phosphatase